jgi:hypothetical protein
MFHKVDKAKYIDLPLSNYSTWPTDRIMKDGKMVGVSTFSGYSSNENGGIAIDTWHMSKLGIETDELRRIPSNTCRGSS